MICQKCHSAKATCHVTDRLPSGEYGTSHYCEACREVPLVPGPVPPLQAFKDLISRSAQHRPGSGPPSEDTLDELAGRLRQEYQRLAGG